MPSQVDRRNHSDHPKKASHNESPKKYWFSGKLRTVCVFGGSLLGTIVGAVAGIIFYRQNVHKYPLHSLARTTTAQISTGLMASGTLIGAMAGNELAKRLLFLGFDNQEDE